MATIAVRIPDSMNKALDQQSAARQVLKSDLVRDALEHFLGTTEFRSLRKQMIPLAEARGVYTDDDVFQTLKS